MPNPFIYANGDSFVEGIELGDFLISSHPGNYDFNIQRPKQLESWFKNYHDESHSVGKERILKHQQIKQEEHSRNFAFKVHQELGSGYKNSGKGGSSFTRIVRDSILDLIELKKTNKNIIALIGTSEPRRMSIPDPDRQDAWLCVILNSAKSNARPLIDYYINHSSDFHALLTYYQNVVLLQEFCKVNNIKLMWVAGNSDLVLTERIEHPETQRLFEYSEFKYDINLPQIAERINIGTKAPGYHFTEIVHEQAAKMILEKI